MILPHDGDRGNMPPDGKLFAVFVAIVIGAIIRYLTLWISWTKKYYGVKAYQVHHKKWKNIGIIAPSPPLM